jgi:CubicO group peptidase (beta-lactamase class C family)
MRALLLLFFGASFGCMSAQVTPAQEKSLDSLFEAYNHENVPGCTVGIIKEGKPVFMKGYGSANLDYKIPLGPESVFSVCGLSRQFIAACIGLLIVQQKINLNDDVGKYIPGMSAFGDTIRIRHLIFHTSGLRDYYGLMNLTGADVNGYFENEYLLRLILQTKGLNNKPGAEFVLSNSNEVIMAEVVRKVSGMSLPEFANRNFFVPLGMEHTYYNEDCHQVLPARATAYRLGSNHRFEQYPMNDDAYGDHGLVTSVSDFVKWDQNFYSMQIGGEVLHQLLLQTVTLNNGETESYGFGNIFGKRIGLKAMHLSGQGAGSRMDYYRFPEAKYTVIILFNREDGIPGTLCMNVAAIFLSPREFKQLSLPAKVKVPVKALEGFAGFYRMNHSGITLEIIDKGDTLRVKGSQSGQEHLLVPIGRHTFRRFDSEQIQLFFSTDAHGKRKLEIQNDGNKVFFSRFDPVKAEEAVLKQYVGTYFNKELMVKYTIEFEKGELIASLPDGDQQKVRPGSKDELNVRADNLRFSRDVAGKITGFILDSGAGVNAVNFEKSAPVSE